MPRLKLKPTHKAVKEYYEALAKFERLGIKHEGAVRSAFQTLLQSCSRQFKLTVTPEYQRKVNGGGRISVDAALLDSYNYPYGYWEAKDSQDELTKEVKVKFEKGYPRNNILFQEPRRAILYQNGKLVVDESIQQAEKLVRVLELFFDYAAPEYASFEDAIKDFKEQISEHAQRLKALIEGEQKTNKQFSEAFASFIELCRQSINPNLSTDAVEEMLLQHIMTERIFRRVFNNPDFVKRNVIAAEIEKVIAALTSKAFNRDAFLQPLDHYYTAIEKSASGIDDFQQKQKFLNTVYEKFFQGFSVKVADTHGIVYTPPQIVEFMVNSVEEILETEFGRSLSDKNVHILDPFVGTGNFIVHVMQKIKPSALTHKYRHELHCNEIMLLPYYIAAMNIEHEFYERTGAYEPFEGICLVDTFDLAEKRQTELFNTVNKQRVLRQKECPIFVVIGNPPYNAGQVNENDDNKNRSYPAVDERIRVTYKKSSKAKLLRKLDDPYVRAIRWASDRISGEGVVAFITNNSFVEELSFDGMREHLAKDYDKIWILNLGGNVRKNPKLSGTTHNVFGIQIGVSINLLVAKRGSESKQKSSIHIASTGEGWRREEKYRHLDFGRCVSGLQWRSFRGDRRAPWNLECSNAEFHEFLPLLDKMSTSKEKPRSIFAEGSLGVSSNRDTTAFDFNREALWIKLKSFETSYNEEVDRYHRLAVKPDPDLFVRYDAIKWSDTLKRHLASYHKLAVDSLRIAQAQYRPFVRNFVYLSDIVLDRPAKFSAWRTNDDESAANIVLCVTGAGSFRPFHTLATKAVACLDSLDKTNCLPLFTLASSGSSRRDNITDWALNEFRTKYDDKKITKWDIFYYVYGVLHHPEYRRRFAANLRRELPRIPLAPDFWDFSAAGKRLAEIHTDYEQQPEYLLEQIENREVKINWRVERMKLSKDKRSLIYNDFLTLSGIPIECFDYCLGNRSALDWVIDQYRVKTDKRSGIVSDPNRPDDPQYIVRLIGQVITVSMETLKIVSALPDLGLKPENRK